MDQALQDLLNDGRIDVEEAKRYAVNKNQFSV